MKKLLTILLMFAFTMQAQYVLKIKKTVTQAGLSRTGCIVQVNPRYIIGESIIPIDRFIWADTSDMNASPTKGTIFNLKEIKTAYFVEISTAPKDCEGSTIALKVLYWISEQVKAQILIDNPKWSDSDVEIIELK